MKKIIICLFFIILCTGVQGNENYKTLILGNWKLDSDYTSLIFIFRPDNGVLIYNCKKLNYETIRHGITYQINGKKLIITYMDNNKIKKLEYTIIVLNSRELRLFPEYIGATETRCLTTMSLVLKRADDGD